MATVTTKYIQRFEVQGEKKVIKANEDIKKSNKENVKATEEMNGTLGKTAKTFGLVALAAGAAYGAIKFMTGSAKLLRADNKEYAKL